MLVDYCCGDAQHQIKMPHPFSEQIKCTFSITLLSRKILIPLYLYLGRSKKVKMYISISFPVLSYLQLKLPKASRGLLTRRIPAHPTCTIIIIHQRMSSAPSPYLRYSSRLKNLGICQSCKFTDPTSCFNIIDAELEYSFFSFSEMYLHEPNRNLSFI